MLEIKGYDELFQGAELLDKSKKDGELYLTALQDEDEKIAILKVKDASTKREYVLRVPPTCKTAMEARAWTFDEEDTDFEKET